MDSLKFRIQSALPGAAAPEMSPERVEGMVMLRVSQLRKLSLGNRYFIAITGLEGDVLAGDFVPTVLLFFEKGAASRDVLQGFFHSYVVRKCLESLSSSPESVDKVQFFPQDSYQQGSDARYLLKLFANEQRILQWALDIVQEKDVSVKWGSNRSYFLYELQLDKEGWNTDNLFLEPIEARFELICERASGPQ